MRLGNFLVAGLGLPPFDTPVGGRGFAVRERCHVKNAGGWIEVQLTNTLNMTVTYMGTKVGCDFAFLNQSLTVEKDRAPEIGGMSVAR